jgi:hypothetical protein
MGVRNESEYAYNFFPWLNGSLSWENFTERRICGIKEEAEEQTAYLLWLLPMVFVEVGGMAWALQKVVLRETGPDPYLNQQKAWISLEGL